MPGDVDPVGDRPAHLVAIGPPSYLRARAAALADVWVVVATGTRIRGEHDHRPSRERRHLVGSGDRHLAALERLSEGVDDVGGEQRELVEEQHAMESTADLAGMDPPAAAAQHA